MDGPKLKPVPLEPVAADDDDREPTKEEIMEDLRIRQGLRAMCWRALKISQRARALKQCVANLR